MPDLNDQLRNLIDGLEDPVSVQETMSAAPTRRYQVPAAVLAGAAVVLIPALVLIGIRWWPADQADVGPSTIPPVVASTTTAAPGEPTTLPPSVGVITVPDVIGLTEAEARRVLEDLGLRMTVTETYIARSGIGLVTSQRPEPGDDAAVDWEIFVGVAVAPTCDNWADASDQVADGAMLVTTFVECAPDHLYPNMTTPITRSVPSGPNVIAATLHALLAGLSDDEIATGLTSAFRSETATALNSVRLDGGKLVVDFNDDILVGSFSTSTGSLFFMAQLQANLFQFEAVETIEFQLNGNCEAFFNWLQGSCQIQTRASWEAAVATWEAERALLPAPGEELTPDNVIGKTFAGAAGVGHDRILQLTDGRQVDSGFDELQRWLLDDPEADPETWRNWTIHVTGLNKELVWLVASDTVTPDGKLQFEVRASLDIPWDEIMPILTSDPFVMSGVDQCSMDGNGDPSLVVVAEIRLEEDQVRGATSPLRAWRINIEQASFEEIPTAGIECLIEFG